MTAVKASTHVLVLAVVSVGSLTGQAAAATAPGVDVEVLPWGAPAAGMQTALALEGSPAVGGTFRFRLLLRSAGGRTVGLPPAGKAFGWILIVQNLGDSKRAYYSEKVPMDAARAAWPAELAGRGPVSLGPFDLSTANVYSSRVARELLTAYVSGKTDTHLPGPAGKLNERLETGHAMAKFTLCLPHEGERPTLVTSGALGITIAPPDVAALKPDARNKFLSDLMKQFDRGPWAGKQAHDTCVQLGKTVLPHVLKAAFETGRPAHARLWLATTVADIPDPRSVGALIQLLDDPAAGVRNVVAYHGVKQRSRNLDKALLDKVKASPATSHLAAWTLLGFMVHRGSVPEEILKAGLESADPRARGTAAEVLAAHASEANIKRLVALLADPNERVRGVAAKMLGKSENRSPAVLGALVKALDRPGESTRQRICGALAELTGKNLPYDPAADPAQRTATLAAWKAWWVEKQPRR